MLANQVQLIGNLGKDAAVRTFENGSTKAQFSVATSDVYINKQGERVTTTDWHTVIAWGPLAQRMEKQGHKGRKVGIIGRLVTRRYEDKEGQTRYITEVEAREIMFLSKDTAPKEAEEA